MSTQLNSKHCEIILKIDEASLDKLKTIITENKNETKEIFGCFKILTNKKTKGNIVHTIGIIEDSLKSGSTDDVSANPTIYNFHTHPISAYELYNVNYGPPSVQDYKSIYLMCKDYNCIVHFVASIEGIYIVYLSPDFKETSGINKIIEQNFKYEDKKVNLNEYLNKINTLRLFVVDLKPWDNLELRKGLKIRFRKSGEWGSCKIRD